MRVLNNSIPPILAALVLLPSLPAQEPVEAPAQLPAEIRAPAEPEPGLESVRGQFGLSLSDGRWLEGRPLALEGSALLWATPGGATESVELGQVLGLHGRAPLSPEGVEVHLVGGDVLVGLLAGGDDAGETFLLRSPVLGELSLPIDRLERAVFVEAAAGAGAEAFRIAADAGEDEALFFRAARGFDADYGAIHRFTADAVLFESVGREPRPRPFSQLAAVALRGGLPAEKQAAATLLTRSGDRVSVDLVAVAEDHLMIELEGGMRVPLLFEDIAALSFRAAGRRWLSQESPLRVVERAWFAEADLPLLPWRVDRSVSGGCLAVGGRAWVHGIGAHSRSSLSFRVPEGAGRFLCAVAIDDEVLELEVRGVAQVAILVGDERVFEGRVQSGAAPLRPEPIAVEPGQLLTLEVDYGPGLDLGDRVDWLGAVFLP